MKVTDNSVLGIIYTFILAVIITVFVGVTLNTFYPSPEPPETKPTEKPYEEMTASDKNVERENEELYKAHEEERKVWSQNSSIIILIAATVLVALGLFLAGKMTIIPNGILLGGLFTIFMGIILGLASQNRYLIFGVTTASLVVIVGAGYLKFVRVPQKK
ncbi:hypothetical protein K0A96_01225 [Patescibacteria group bacterium]|nr:hypothetical protein [Patescibacteria group bacterium]